MSTFRLRLIAGIISMFLPFHLSMSQPDISKSDVPEGIDPAVRQEIMRLYSGDAGQRATAARTLGKLGEGSVPAIPFLAEMLGETDDVVERASPIPSQGPVSHVGIGDKQYKVGELVAEALGNIGRPALSPLVSALREGRKWERIHAAQALGKIKDTSAVTALIEAIQDGDERLRKCAVVSLGDADDPRVVDQLLVALKDEQAIVRSSAATQLGKRDQSNVVEALLGTVHDDDVKVRSAVVEALGWMSDARVVATIDSAAGDSAREVLIACGGAQSRRFWARQALRSAAIVLEKTQKWRATHSLHGAFWNDYSKRRDSVQQIINEALGKSNDSLAVTMLISLLSNTWVNVEPEAARCLGRLGSKEAVGHLTAALGSKDENVRREAAWSLGVMRGARAEASLRIAAGDSSSSVRTVGVWALGELRVADAKQITRSVLSKLYSSIADSATLEIMQKDPQVVPVLISIAGLFKAKVAALRQEAASSLRVGSDGAPILRVNLDALDPSETLEPYARAIRSLGHIRDRRATECLVDVLSEFEGVGPFHSLSKSASEVEEALTSLTERDVDFERDIPTWRRWVTFIKVMQTRD
jgi:HEAT repeat protein